jgi:carbon storage regulator
MLVLTRKIDETIVIGGCIKVKLLQIGSDRVRLGIEAPPDVVVDREEIHLQRAEWTPRLEANMANALKGGPIEIDPEDAARLRYLSGNPAWTADSHSDSAPVG